MERRFIEHEGSRIESGPLIIGDDWPGVFIRGDNAFGMLMQLNAIERVLRSAPVSIDPLGLGRSSLRRLRRLLASCVVGDVGDRLRQEIEKEEGAGVGSPDGLLNRSTPEQG